MRDVTRAGTPDRVVVTSKTFRSLARLTGAAPAEEGPAVRRVLRRDDLAPWVPKLAGMTFRQRAELPGVSVERAPQVLAGALVAEAAFELLGVEEGARLPVGAARGRHPAAPRRDHRGGGCGRRARWRRDGELA